MIAFNVGHSYTSTGLRCDARLFLFTGLVLISNFSSTPKVKGLPSLASALFLGARKLSVRSQEAGRKLCGRSLSTAGESDRYSYLTAQTL